MFSPAETKAMRFYGSIQMCINFYVYTFTFVVVRFASCRLPVAKVVCDARRTGWAGVGGCGGGAQIYVRRAPTMLRCARGSRARRVRRRDVRRTGRGGMGANPPRHANPPTRMPRAARFASYLSPPHTTAHKYRIQSHRHSRQVPSLIYRRPG
jgi:hypothetical protein